MLILKISVHLQQELIGLVTVLSIAAYQNIGMSKSCGRRLVEEASYTAVLFSVFVTIVVSHIGIYCNALWTMQWHISPYEELLESIDSWKPWRTFCLFDQIFWFARWTSNLANWGQLFKGSFNFWVHDKTSFAIWVWTSFEVSSRHSVF